MIEIRRHTAPLAALTLLITLVAGCATGDQNSPSERQLGQGLSASSQRTQPPASPLPTTSMTTPPAGTAAAAAWEALMGPDGEYAAAAAYTAVLDRYGTVEPYATIREAELRHISALTRQLERMGYTVPANPWLGTISAPENLQAAAEAWAEGEVKNVQLYDRLMADAAGDAQLTRVFTNLRRASQEMHLPMFEQAAANGGTLTG